MIDYPLSVRTMNCLLDAGINTIDELFSKSDEDLSNIYMLGNWCLDDIKEFKETNIKDILVVYKNQRRRRD